MDSFPEEIWFVSREIFIGKFLGTILRRAKELLGISCANPAE
jgi:hypothetical protein